MRWSEACRGVQRVHTRQSPTGTGTHPSTKYWSTNAKHGTFPSLFCQKCQYCKELSYLKYIYITLFRQSNLLCSHSAELEITSDITVLSDAFSSVTLTNQFLYNLPLAMSYLKLDFDRRTLSNDLTARTYCFLSLGLIETSDWMSQTASNFQSTTSVVRRRKSHWYILNRPSSD